MAIFWLHPAKSIIIVLM